MIKKKTSKKKRKNVSSGFLSQNDKPTQNALTMYFVYLTNLPENWDIQKMNDNAVLAVRNYFGWKLSSGFDVMIKWGIKLASAKSTTSNGRYLAMSKAFFDAQGMIGKDYVLTTQSV